MYRTRYPAEMLGNEFNYGFPPSDPRVNTYDVIIIQRATHEFFLKWIPEAQARGQKVIYDIDDNLWEIPVTNPAFRPYNSGLKKQTKKIIQLCNAVTVSTDPLRDYFLRNNFNKNVITIPNFLHHVHTDIEKSDKVRIGSHLTNTHAGDWNKDLIFALDKIKDIYDNVELVFMGWNPMRGSKDRYEFHPFVESDKFFDYLKTLKMDILVAPLTDCEFNRAKSNIKYLEASACKCASICQDVYPYSKSIDHGETGYLVRDNKDWYKYLVTLIEGENFRRQMAENAYQYVSDNFTFAKNSELLLGLYDKVFRSIE